MKKNFTCRDFRFTTKDGYLYAAAMKTSDDGEYTIVSLGEQDASKQANFHGIIRSVETLGEGEAKWSRDENGLHIHSDLKSDMPIVFKIRID